MSLRCPDLAFLPGMCPNTNIGQTRFPKVQYFTKYHDLNVLIDKVEPGVPCNPFDRNSRFPSIYARGEVTDLPAWIVLDKQMLRFDAYFQATLQEFQTSQFQIRKCVIYFYLEDATIKVVEPKQLNSGISQGTLIGRQRIRLPKPKDDLFYDIIDFNIGREIELFGKVFKLTNCDKFTKTFLNRCGISVPDPINTPKDPYYLERDRLKDTLLPRKPYYKVDTFGQFLELDRKVLRFYGYWDDREAYGGIIHDLEIHYYLCDDTMDIREIVPGNSGKDSGFMFIRRGRLPKFYDEIASPGIGDTMTTLNVIVSGMDPGRYVVDPLHGGKSNREYYKQTDLAIGSAINCYGRKIVLTDCDLFTREFYRSKYGLDNFTPKVKPEVEKPVEIKPLHERVLPPWNGYGSFEDSAQNCVTVEMKPVLRNLKQFLTKDRKGIDSHVLRFLAKLRSKHVQDNDRNFIILYYLCDSTMSVYEISGSKFMVRGPKQLPGQEMFTSLPPDYYQAEHMFVGATINLNGFTFVLVEADEYSLRYMELHNNEFPKANINLVLNKLRAKLEPIYKDFVAENLPKEQAIIPFEELRSKLCKVMGPDWTEHEMLTVARHFSAICRTERFDRNYIRSLILTELKRMLWSDMDKMKEYFYDVDYKRTGFLPRKKVYSLLRGCRVPLDKELIDHMLDVIEKNEKCDINYEDLFKFMNRYDSPLPDALPVNINAALFWASDTPLSVGKMIDWDAFNKGLNLEHLFAPKPVMAAD